jgi:hypothetical protein
VLVDETGMLLSPEIWLSLLASGTIENHIFGLREEAAARSGAPNEEFKALSTKLLMAGSKSSLVDHSSSRRR